TLPADDARSVRAKSEAARLAQPLWAESSLRDRLRAIEKFRAAVVEDAEDLALTLTLDTGKPITQARNELKGLLTRIDFFLEEAPAALRPQKVHVDSKAKL